MVYRFSECALKIYHRAYALDLQGGGAAAGAEVIRCDFVSTSGTKGRLHAGDLALTFSAQPRADPTAANATRGKQKIE
jgi:hypothetical protein